MTRPLPKSYLTGKKREEVLRTGRASLLYAIESCEAMDAGDMDASWAWLAMADVPAHTLMYLKKSSGADFIRKWGFNTAEADARYGPDWLDKP